MQDEIRKLKAMIVKHEKRLRILEAGPAGGEKRSDKAEVPPPPPLSDPPPSISISNTKSAEELAPDEV